MRRLSVDLAKPKFTESGIRNKITRWLSGAFVTLQVHVLTHAGRAEPVETNMHTEKREYWPQMTTAA